MRDAAGPGVKICQNPRLLGCASLRTRRNNVNDLGLEGWLGSVLEPSMIFSTGVGCEQFACEFEFGFSGEHVAGEEQVCQREPR